MNINIKRAISATAVIATIVVGGSGCAPHNTDSSKASGKPSQATTEQPKKDTPAPGPQATTRAPSQSGADDKSNNTNNGAKTNNDTTFTQTLSEDEARALDEQGLRGGVISRENGLTVTRDGNVLTFAVDKDASATGGTVVTASDVKKAEADAKKAADANATAGDTPATGDNGNNTVPGGIVNPPNGDGGTVVVPIVTPGGDTGNHGTPGNNTGTNPTPFIPTPIPAPAPNPGAGDQTPAPTPAPGPDPVASHADQATAFMQSFRAKYLGLINKARTDLGLKPLVPSEELTNSAQTWASYSAEDGLGGAHYRDWKTSENEGHDLDGVTQFKGENVSDTTATGGGYIGDDNNTADAIAARVFNQSMNQDQGKRSTILDADVDRVGIGVSEEVMTGYLDANGHIVRTGRKDQAIKTVVQTGSSANQNQVGPDDKVVEYKSEDKQTMDAAENNEFNNSLPKVDGKASAETPAPNTAPAAAETPAPSHESAPATQATPDADPAPESAPATEAAPESNLAPAAVEVPAPVESDPVPAAVDAPVESAPVENAAPVTQAAPAETPAPAVESAPVTQAAPAETPAPAVESAPVTQAAPVAEQHAPAVAAANSNATATPAVESAANTGVTLGVGE